MHVHLAAELGSRLRDERGLARRRLDQVRLAVRAHRREHETRQTAAAADVGKRPRGGRVDRRQAAQRVQHVTRGGLCRISDRRDAHRRRAHQAHEQREAVELGATGARDAADDDAARDLGGRFT